MPRWTRFRQLFGPDPQGDVDAELAFHLEMRTAELVARGESPARAAELARQRFGEFERTRSALVRLTRHRETKMARREWVRDFLQDVAYAIRTLRRTPGFAAVAVAILAVGIGATSAVFSVVHTVLFEGLPYRAAERLYLVRTVYPDGTPYPLSAPDFMSVQASARSLERVEAYARGTVVLSGRGEPREARGARVSRGFFDMLGLGTAIGRGFTTDEHVPGKGKVAVLDHQFWTAELGADPGVVGRTLSVAGEPYVVVGVLAPGARLSERVQVYSPIEYGPTFDAQTARGRRGEFLRVVARARAGATAAEIDTDLRGIGQQLQQAFPDTNAQQTFGATPLRELMVGDAERPLLVLFAAVALVLLVACANVASLLLARGSARRGELAVRASLGAGRGRLVRQLVAEALVLGLAGGALGAALAYAAVGALVRAQPADIPRLDAVAVDGTVLLFTFACALVTAVLFGVIPALQSTGRDLLQHVRTGGRGGDAGGHRVRGALVVAETTLAVVLLVAAGLFLRSFVALSRVDPGFVAERGVSFRVMLQGPAYAEREAIVRTADRIVERLRALPGVTAAAATSELPLTGVSTLWTFSVAGAPPPPPNVNAEIAVVGATDEYLRALGATLLRGRGLAPSDSRPDAPPVALLNEAAVRRWFPSRDAIGGRVMLGDLEVAVVGVIRDLRQEGLHEPAAPQLYTPFARMPSRGVDFVVRATGDAAALAASVRRAVGEVDPGAPIAEYAPLGDLVSASVARPRLYTSLLAAFAATALLLAAVGLFGVLSYSVLQRSREIGVRLALGARASQVTGMVVGSALRLVGLGLAFGVLGALAAGRLLRSQLFGVQPADPATLAAVAAVLLAAALAASYVPARRASSLDPGEVLREG